MLWLILVAACADARNESRAPATPAVVEVQNGVRVVHNDTVAPRIAVKRGVPRDARLLFAGVTAAARRPDGVQAVVAPDGSRILEFGRDGRFLRSVGDTTIVKAIGVAFAQGTWIVTEREGRIVELGSGGEVSTAFATSLPTSVIAPFGGGFVEARSPFAVSTAPLPAESPLVIFAPSSGQSRDVIDTVSLVGNPSAGYLNNSALIAANDQFFFLALFVRDQVRAYDARGRLRWISHRRLDWAAPATATATPSGTSLSFSAVNLGVTADQRTVYVLSHADSTEQQLRLDVLDAETGVVERTARLGLGPWLISLDDRGAIWTAPLDTLFALATPRARAAMPGFQLATLRGDTFDLASTRGRVTLLNFWASWCPPCREEFPLMNRLAKDLANAPFTIVAVNEDVDEQAARRFLAETPASFVIPLGRGAMQKHVAYRGLPYTVLLDRKGRIVERFFGFGGPAQFNSLRRRIDAALAER